MTACHVLRLLFGYAAVLVHEIGYAAVKFTTSLFHVNDLVRIIVGQADS